MTPNVKRLIIEQMANLAVERGKKHAPPGEHGLAAAMAVDILHGSISRDYREAREFAENAIAAVRKAPDVNPNWSDEEIAGMILGKLGQARPGQGRAKQ